MKTSRIKNQDVKMRQHLHNKASQSLQHYCHHLTDCGKNCPQTRHLSLQRNILTRIYLLHCMRMYKSQIWSIKCLSKSEQKKKILGCWHNQMSGITDVTMSNHVRHKSVSSILILILSSLINNCYAVTKFWNSRSKLCKAHRLLDLGVSIGKWGLGLDE